ncbi:MAG: aminotransferase class V-fold PLP-dependent enzyme, partial [Saprospiraceae bacterium]|nr:aminotransferase class V-fold PLP-dependent enzyme [Saprospiraceae bacterium]
MMKISHTRSASLQCQRSRFDLSDDVTYLNCAYLSPLLNSSVTAGIAGMRRKARPHNVFKDDFFDPLKELQEVFAKLIDCRNSQRIAFQPSASYGMATVVKNLVPKPGGNVVLLQDQFPSHVYAFRAFAAEHNLEVRTVKPLVTDVDGINPWNQAILDAIDEDTVCVSCPHIHWADGTIIDLNAIREKTFQHKARFVVDGTQSIGALPFSIEALQPDALICSAYKYLLGPYTSCLSYYGPTFDGGSPLEYNWITRVDSDQFGHLVNYKEEFRPFAFRYNMGECSNFIMIPMLLDSIKQILAWGSANIQSYCRSIVEPFLVGVARKGYGFESRDRANHLFGIYLSDYADPER